MILFLQPRGCSVGSSMVELYSHYCSVFHSRFSAGNMVALFCAVAEKLFY